MLGAVHYYVIFWMPKDFRLPKPDKRGWRRHGMTKIEAVRNPVEYMAKCVSKEATTRPFPSGMRMRGRCDQDNMRRIELRWWCCPLCVRRW